MKNGGRLGRGLQSLLPETLDFDESEETIKVDSEFFRCPIGEIHPNPYQPRKNMDDHGLAELAASIREKGIIQPLLVRKDGENGGYELIAGERRLRAAKRAGLDEVPVIVKTASAEDRLELALIENIQRENLNPIEEAIAYRRLSDEFGLTQEEVARKVGKDRSTVANIMRLLLLPDFVKQDMADNRYSMGHARVLLGLATPEEIKDVRDRIVAEGLTVRQVEMIVGSKKTKRKAPAIQNTATKKPIPESYCSTLASDVTRILGSKSKIIQNGSRGKIEIEYYSLDDLERIHSFFAKLQTEN